MSLNLEWRHRIDIWRAELPRHFYRELGEVAFEGFVTAEQLTPEEALQREFKPVKPGERWGSKWEYGWFKAQVRVREWGRGPRASLSGQRIVVKPDLGGESTVFVNGVASGAIDHAHKEITLTRSAESGAAYDLLVEAYAGHGPVYVHSGPRPPERKPEPDPGPTRALIGRSTFGIWHEVAYQLWIDVETLYQLRNGIDQESLRVAEIDAGLRDFAVIVDFELPLEERLKTFQAARERLAPLLACTNGTTAPTLFGFGHSHIDVAWLWPLAETARKCGRTFGTQLALMDEYPEYIFQASQAHLFMMTQNRYPELYERIKQAAKRGQFVPEGAMWVEADTNITGGESLVRQFIHGKRFFRDEFGVECELMWLPDVFGYSGAVPQIMRGCGIKYFSTAKIFWAYNGGDPFPYNTFTWEGIDGSEILVHLTNDYNSHTEPTTVLERWNKRVQKDGIATRLFPFGYGDGGGGPTRDHIEYVRRLANLEGAPKVVMAHPLAYFRDQEERGIPEARYVGELYFQAHRGTYTSQARTKRGNRKSEVALREAEMWGVASAALAGKQYPLATLDGLWKKVLLNQFHDIIPGSSIGRVYQEAQVDHAAVIATAGRLAGEAQSALAGKGNALSVFNSLSWERCALVELPAGFVGAAGLEGELLPQQRIGNSTFVEASVPACGWTTLRASKEAKGVGRTALKATPGSLENEFLRLQLDEKGQISSLFDKQTQRELAAGPCNALKMYKDVPTAWDAWDLDSIYPLTPVALDEPATIDVLAEGPLVAQLRVSRKLHDSTLVQVISLRRGSRRIDFETVIEWRERHKLLKVNFPVDIHANEAVHEIQFGHIARPTHQSRQFDADRFEVSAHKWSALMEANRGCAVLNDCKYGVNVAGNSINLTLLKSALAPDESADQGRQEFTYAFYAWNGAFAECDLVRQGYDLNVPVSTVAGDAGAKSLFTLDAPNIVLETVKAAEDGSGDVILRLYEAKHMATRCKLTGALKASRVRLTNMLEQGDEELPMEACSVMLELRPFEIKTLRLTLA